MPDEPLPPAPTITTLTEVTPDGTTNEDVPGVVYVIEPAGIEALHAPDAQNGVPAPHAFPHEPQLLGSTVVSVQVEPQTVCPAGQAHDPELQIRVARHALPHAPQLVVVRTSVSHPFVRTPSQFAKPAPHEIPQMPVVQIAVVFGAAAPGHVTPHVPQFSRSVCRLTSHPVAATPSQSPNPALHPNPHTPVEHDALDAFAGTGHGVSIVPRPSALHSRRIVGEPHVAVPGVQTQLVQVPLAHEAPDGQLTVMVPSPSGQITTSVLDAQLIDPGVQDHGEHRPWTQLCIAAQGFIV